jgi:hypothetical protein
MPQLTSVIASENVGASWCNALQMRSEKRFSQGYTLQASYTWSKNIEAMSRRRPARCVLVGVLGCRPAQDVGRAVRCATPGWIL